MSDRRTAKACPLPPTYSRNDPVEVITTFGEPAVGAAERSPHRLLHAAEAHAARGARNVSAHGPVGRR